MNDILFIKTSSLGDVIHHMPAVTEAHAALPDARISWLVEEAFAPLVALHPAVNAIVPVAWRRWRRQLYSPAILAEIAQSCSDIRARGYDVIIDTQGLLRTGIMARIARGYRHGYDRSSVREPLAAAFYDTHHSISREMHAVERNRMLTGLALGYKPQGEPDFGLVRKKLTNSIGQYAVLLHATAQPQKEWPVTDWMTLGRNIAAMGIEIVLPWGTAAERVRSEQIAATLPGARVPERAPLDQVAHLIAGAQFVVGVDTGLLHLAAALSVPLVGIFAGSKPHLTGPVGRGPLAVLGVAGTPPTIAAVTDEVARIAAETNSSHDGI